MEVVLGVSMTPKAVRMVLVEGAAADGVTLDTNVEEVRVGANGGAEQVAAAILGTREAAADGAHRIGAIGVAWTDHTHGARLREVLRANAIDDVVMVSELHAASALAQAVGRRTGCERTALLFLERSDLERTAATLAVVRTADGAVVAVQSRSLHADEAVTELPAMVAALQHTAEPPEALFIMGAGFGSAADVADLAGRIGETTPLPVHAPEDADLALARGAALAAAGAPRFEAQTAVVATDSTEPPADTAVGVTRLAAAGYLAPLGYSAVPAEDDLDDLDGLDGLDELDDLDDRDDLEGPDAGKESPVDPAEKPFLLVGSTLATIFVVGVAALMISLAVRISPAVEQRPDPGQMLPPTAPAAAQEPGQNPSSPVIETIQAPRPVVQQAPVPQATLPQAPRPVSSPAPAAPAPALEVAPVAPAPEVVPVPAPVAPAPVTVTAPAAPAPAFPPIVISPVIPLLPPFLQPSVRVPAVPATKAPATAPSTAPQTAAPVPSSAALPSTAPSTAAPVPSSAAAVPATEGPPQATSGGGSGRGKSGTAPDSGSASGSRGSQTPIWPIWPPFGN